MPSCLYAAAVGAGSAYAATTDVADAAKRGDRDAVRAALARKADVNAAQIDGSTALHWAAERDDLDMADQLIRAGARVTARTREGVTPLQLAATNGSATMIDRLLKAGADVNAPLSAGGRHGADDGGAHWQDRCDSRAALKRAATSTPRRAGAERRR